MVTFFKPFLQVSIYQHSVRGLMRFHYTNKLHNITPRKLINNQFSPIKPIIENGSFCIYRAFYLIALEFI